MYATKQLLFKKMNYQNKDSVLFSTHSRMVFAYVDIDIYTRHF